VTLAIGFITPALICGWSLLAAPTNLHRSDFNTQYDGCLSTVAAARHTVEQAHIDATRRGGAPAAGPVPDLATAFDSLQTQCFDQKYLSALNHDRAQFDTVRAGALDAWRYASQPSSSGPGEEVRPKRTNSPIPRVSSSTWCCYRICTTSTHRRSGIPSKAF
jgi:hypothetical protein